MSSPGSKYELRIPKGECGFTINNVRFAWLGGFAARGAKPSQLTASALSTEHRPMEDWALHLDRILQADDRELLQDAGRISAEIAKEHAENEFEKYRVTQDRLFKSDFDRQMELPCLE
ncbi:MAG: virulence RhuM family protein [Akkermansia sp.]|nr:virulence RhuM family protein [Akkermansia sp.]MBR5185578.1 virulence RhuM family protein [Akkermansia sp.]